MKVRNNLQFIDKYFDKKARRFIGNKIKYLLINENQIERGLLSKYTTMLLNSYWALKNNYIPIINFQYRNYEIKENQFNDLFLTNFELRKEKAGNNEYIRDSRNLPSLYDFWNEDFFSSSNKIIELNSFSKKYLPFNNAINQRVADNLEKFLFDKNMILGVKARGGDYNQLKLRDHYRQPTSIELFKKIEEITSTQNFDFIFLSTEDEDIINTFEKEYSQKLKYCDFKRKNFSDIKFVKTINESFELNLDDALNYVIEIILLSNSDYLLGGINSGMVCAAILNNNKSPINVINNERYK